LATDLTDPLLRFEAVHFRSAVNAVGHTAIASTIVKYCIILHIYLTYNKYRYIMYIIIINNIV
jgi:hypothetical protein